MGAFLLIVLALVAYLIINDRKRSKSMMDLLDHQTTELEKRDKKNQELIEKLTRDREEKEKEEQTEKNLVAIFIKLNLVLMAGYINMTFTYLSLIQLLKHMVDNIMKKKELFIKHTKSLKKQKEEIN